jgi:hypothetical protein
VKRILPSLVALARTVSLLVIVFVVAAPSLATSGWYLLVPPRSEYNERAECLSGYKILDDKPLALGQTRSC